MIKPSIAVGKDSSGKLHLLYLGHDASKAIEISRATPEMEIEIYRKPLHFKRFAASAAAAESKVQSPESKVERELEVDFSQDEPEVPIFPSKAQPVAPAPKKKR